MFPLIAQQQLHDIAPPVEYSLVPTWIVFCLSALVLSLLGLTAWWFFSRKRPLKPGPTPRQIALTELQKVESEIPSLSPYKFSIRVSDSLRRYVSEEFNIPLTRQTSVEFLAALSGSGSFTEAERSLLAEFLNRCDLIKFARYEATADDSRRLLEEARQFVKGAQVAAV